MGIYDREYYRDEPRRPGIGDWSAVTTLIVINVAVYVADMVSAHHWIVEHLMLPWNVFSHPWDAWKLVTYGFAHDPFSIMHILFNMFALWLFGREIEGIYGKSEFYKLYLSLIVLSGLAWVALQNVLWPGQPAAALGASGAVVGITMIFILHFPDRIILLFFIPMPAWVAGIVMIAIDVAGVTGGVHIMREHVANTAHLAGALFGIVYYRSRWTLFSLWPWQSVKRWLRRPKLRVHRGDAARESPDERNWKQQEDAILAKISRTGEASLTDDERRTMVEISRRYRNRQHGTKG